MTGGLPQCECPEGTAGALCEQDTHDDCAGTNPCKRGFCIDDYRGYKCNCPA